jgi:hypothetical protein
LWRTARPTCSIRRCLKRVIDRALEKDRAKATAEFLAEFRTEDAAGRHVDGLRIGAGNMH